MWSCCRTWLAMLAMLTASAVEAGFWQQNIERVQWAEHLASHTLTRIPAIAGLLERFDERDDMHVTLRYPGGDAGEAWAELCLSWLVALGIPSDYISVEPGSGGLDILHLSLEFDDSQVSQ